MKRKIIKVGNSLGVIIPAIYLEELNLSHQDEVEVEYQKDLNVITIRNIKTTPNDNYLEKVVKGVVDDYLKQKGIGC